MSLADTIDAGLNNPECAFFVGQTFGQATTGAIILKVTAIYFGIKIIDKIIFSGIPKIYKKLRGKSHG